jgi:hypothetical protein
MAVPQVLCELSRLVLSLARMSMEQRQRAVPQAQGHEKTPQQSESEMGVTTTSVDCLVSAGWCQLGCGLAQGAALFHSGQVFSRQFSVFSQKKILK